MDRSFVKRVHKKWTWNFFVHATSSYLTDKKGDARITLKDIEDGEEESEDELQPVNFGVRQTPKPVSAEAHIVPEAQKGI